MTSRNLYDILFTEKVNNTSPENINQVDKRNRTLLYFACAYQHTKGVDMLLQKGANPNIYSNRGVSPLLLGAYKRNSKIIKKLIIGGANPELDIHTDKYCYRNPINNILFYNNINLFHWIREHSPIDIQNYVYHFVNFARKGFTKGMMYFYDNTNINKELIDEAYIQAKQYHRYSVLSYLNSLDEQPEINKKKRMLFID